MDTLLQDLRFAFRSFARRPAFAAVVVLTVAIATGGCTAIFTLLYGMLVRPLPFAEPGRLAALSMQYPEGGVVDGRVSLPDLMSVAEQCTSCTGVAAAESWSAVLDDGEQPERVRGAAVTPGLFELLGVPPHLGRTFLPEDGVEGTAPRVVVSYGLWQRSGGEPDLVGRALRVNGEPAEVVGVMPPGFAFPHSQDVWRPLVYDPDEERTNRYLEISLVRLAPGATLPALRQELTAVGERLAADFPVSNRGWSFAAGPLRDEMSGSGTRQAMYLLLGAVGFLLLVACANIANLLLAREGARRREMAIRQAVGAGGGRLVRQLLTESLLLALAGGALGVLLAVWSLDLVLATNPEPLPFWQSFQLEPAVLAFSFAVTLAAGLLFGLLPALRAARTDVRCGLLGSAGDGAADRAGRRLQRLLVSAEVALSLALTFGAALLVQSYVAQVAGDAGFDTARKLTFRTTLVGERYAEPADRAAYLDRLTERLQEVPGVLRAAATGALPVDDGGGLVAVEAEGRPLDAGHEVQATYVGSTAGLFDVLGTPLVAGRGFTRAETLDPEARVVLINRALGERLWPGQDPLGRRLRFDGDDELWLTVVGVSPDLQWEEFREETAVSRRQIHLPCARAAWRTMSLIVATAGAPAAVADDVRTAFAAVDATLPLWELRTYDQVRWQTSWGEAVLGVLLAYFALVAVLLAALGIYGVVAFAVTRRVREIGIRLAVGAERRQVVALFLGEGLLQALLGVAAGLLGALALSRLLTSLLYGVRPQDPSTLLLTPLALLAVALLASYLPARKAAKVDPLDALRAD